MDNFDIAKQKIKGKLQQIQGKVKQQAGQESEGVWDQIKGKANETIADIRSNGK